MQTPKGDGEVVKISAFLQQATKRSASDVFLQEHWGFLSSIPTINPLLEAYRKGQLLPTPCLDQITTVLATMKEEEVPSANKKKGRKPRVPKRYSILIYVANGVNSVESLDRFWEADLFGDAERLADRLLFKQEDALYAEICQTIGEKVIRTRIHRNDAVGRMLRSGRGPICQRGSKKTTNSLGFQPKANPSKSRRSYG